MYMLAIYYYAICCDIDSMVSLCIIVSFVTFFFFFNHHHHHHFCFLSVPSILSHSRLAYRPGQIAAQQLKPAFPSLPSLLYAIPCFSAFHIYRRVRSIPSTFYIRYNHNVITLSVRQLGRKSRTHTIKHALPLSRSVPSTPLSSFIPTLVAPLKRAPPF